LFLGESEVDQEGHEALLAEFFDEGRAPTPGTSANYLENLSGGTGVKVVAGGPSKAIVGGSEKRKKKTKATRKGESGRVGTGKVPGGLRFSPYGRLYDQLSPFAKNFVNLGK